MTEFLKACFDGPILFRLLSGAIIVLIIIWVIWGNQLTKYKEDRENQRNKKHDNNAEEVLENTENILDILQNNMKTIETTRHSELILKYPLGYCLFAIDHKKIIIPYNSGFELNYEMNWDNARVLELNSKEIVIKLPDIYDLDFGNKFTNPTLKLPRQIGFSIIIFDIRGKQMISEVFTEDEYGIIAVLGFRNE